MNKLISLGALLVAVAALNSCKNTAENDNEVPIPAGMVRIDLTKSGLPATIDIPDTVHKVFGILPGSDGSVQIFEGNGFYLTINVSGEPIAMKKNDINGDDLNKPKAWVVNDSTQLLYSTQKDTNAFANAKEEFHFYCILRKGKATYYAEDLRQSTDGTVHTFSKDQAQTMLTAAKSLMPATPPAKKE